MVTTSSNAGYRRLAAGSAVTRGLVAHPAHGLGRTKPAEDRGAHLRGPVERDDAVLREDLGRTSGQARRLAEVLERPDRAARGAARSSELSGGWGREVPAAEAAAGAVATKATSRRAGARAVQDRSRVSRRPRQDSNLRPRD